MDNQLSSVKIKRNSTANLGNKVKQLCWSPSGNQLACLLEPNMVALMSAYQDGGVKKIELSGKPEIITWGGNDSRIFVAYDDGGVGSIEVEDGKVGQIFYGQRRKFIFLSSSGKEYIGVTETGRIINGSHLGFVNQSESIGSVTAASFHGRGLVARSGSGLETIFTRHQSSGEVPKTIVSLSKVNCHAWNNNGTVFLMGLSNSAIHLCNLNEQKEFILDGHDSGVVDISVCADDRFAASLDTEGNIIFWDLFTRTPVTLSGDKISLSTPHWLEFKPRTYLLALGNNTIEYYNTDFVPSKEEEAKKIASPEIAEDIITTVEVDSTKIETKDILDIPKDAILEEKKGIDQNKNSKLVQRYKVFLGSLNDVAAKNDTLGFKPYSDGLLNFLLSKDTAPPLTVSIEGEWGEGKTSFMYQMKRKIDESSAPKTITEKAKYFLRRKNKSKNKESYLTIWFQPWKYEKEEALWAVFALEFMRQVKGQMNILKRPFAWLTFIVMRIKGSDSKFDILKNLLIRLVLFVLFILIGVTIYEIGLPKLDPLIKVISNSKEWGWLTEVSKIVDNSYFTGHLILYIVSMLIFYFSISNFLVKNLKGNLKKYLSYTEHTGKMPYIENLHSDLMILIQCYCKSKRVFVFIDDLDRCETPKAADLIQAITMMLPENASTILLLGIDREKLAASISARHFDVAKIISGADDGKILKYGYDYLGKFIQIPFHLPRAQAINLRKMLDIKNLGEKKRRKFTLGLRLYTRLFYPSIKYNSGRVIENTVVETNALDDARKVVISEISDIILPDNYSRSELSKDETVQIVEVGILLSASLNFNPRMLKQFMNLFRLSVFLAESNKLLRTSSLPTAPLTLEIIGKFVALSIRWPSILAYIKDKPYILSAMQRRVVPSDVPSSLTGRQKAIYREYDIDNDRYALNCIEDNEFKEFLLAGIHSFDTHEYNEDYIFKGIEVDYLVTIAIQ